jgi:hypothetical protein
MCDFNTEGEKQKQGTVIQCHQELGMKSNGDEGMWYYGRERTRTSGCGMGLWGACADPSPGWGAPHGGKWKSSESPANPLNPEMESRPWGWALGSTKGKGLLSFSASAKVLYRNIVLEECTKLKFIIAKNRGSTPSEGQII